MRHKIKTISSIILLLLITLILTAYGSAVSPVSFETTPLIRSKGIKPRKGRLLVATRKLKDPIFAKSVILLLSYNTHGALGLIVNKPTRLQLSKAFPEIKGIKSIRDTVYLGGPVEGNLIFILLRTQKQPKDAHLVFEHIYYSTDKGILKRIIKAKRGEREFRVFAGYSGWAKGQLDREIMRGSWYVLDADPDIIFNTEPSKVWETLIRKGTELQAMRNRQYPTPERQNPANYSFIYALRGVGFVFAGPEWHLAQSSIGKATFSFSPE